VHDALIQSFYSAIVAKVLSHQTGFRQSTDAFTAAMFHNLGRTLVIHYFSDKYEAIIDCVDQRPTDELTAAREILGIPYHELGADVAREWKFPETIIQAMLPLRRGELDSCENDGEHIGFIVAFANQICAAALSAELETANDRISILCERTQRVWSVDREHLRVAFDQANALSVNYAKLLKLDPSSQPSLVSLTRDFGFRASID